MLINILFPLTTVFFAISLYFNFSGIKDIQLDLTKQSIATTRYEYIAWMNGVRCGGRSRYLPTESAAVQWYKKKFEEGDSHAALALAHIYQSGNNYVKKDVKKYIFWLKKSAEQGYDRAQFELAIAYKIGNTLPPNYKESVKWHLKASKTITLSYYYLSEIYQVGGYFLAENKTNAYRYAYVTSILLDNRKKSLALKTLKSLGETLSPEQIDTAKQEGDRIIKHHKEEREKTPIPFDFSCSPLA